MLRRFKHWIETRRLAKQAKAALNNAETNGLASAHLKTILAALAERKPVCRHCFQIYQPREMTFPERFQIRALLIIPDSEPDPMLCDGCFQRVVCTYNPQAANIGTSNSGHANMVLKHLG